MEEVWLTIDPEPAIQQEKMCKLPMEGNDLGRG